MCKILVKNLKPKNICFNYTVISKFVTNMVFFVKNNCYLTHFYICNMKIES